MNTNLIPPAEYFGHVSFTGQRSYCVGSASDYGHVVYLSMVGFKTANKALWAALMEKRNSLQIGRVLFSRLDGPYVHTDVQLPDIGMNHMVLVHSQAVVSSIIPDKLFYVLGDDPEHERFYAMLNRAVALPILPEWADYLWDWGWDRKLIRSLTTQGIDGCAVNVTLDKWEECITEGISKGRIQ